MNSIFSQSLWIFDNVFPVEYLSIKQTAFPSLGPYKADVV